MKKLLFFFILIPFFANAQSDTSTFREYHPFSNTYGPPHKNVKWLEKSTQILLVTRDSMYNTLSDEQLDRKLRNGHYRMEIVTNPDSINKIVSKQIKAVMILKEIDPKTGKPK